MYECSLREQFNHCRFLQIEAGEYLCANTEEGCSFRTGEISSEEETGGAPTAYVRKERWYEEYYPDSRPVRSGEN